MVAQRDGDERDEGTGGASRAKLAPEWDEGDVPKWSWRGRDFAVEFLPQTSGYEH
jgi:hypothetical protein